MITFGQAFGGGGSAALGVETFAILASRTLPAFTKGGRVHIAAMGAPGSGARSGSGYGATGANSSPWGEKVIDVAIGDVLEFVVGAGGAVRSTDGAGNVGNSTLVKLNGVTIMTAQPGEPGAYGNSFPLNAPVPTATVVGADYVVPGLRAGAVAAVGNVTGGAAVDIFRSGLGRSVNRAGASVGVDGGDNANPALPLQLSSPALGVSIVGINTAGMAGLGGSSASSAGGMFAGGCGGVSGTAGGAGGRGAGGGGSAGNNGGPGGDGYAYVIYIPEE